MVGEVLPLRIASRQEPACCKTCVEDVQGFNTLFPMQYSVHETAAVMAASFF